MKRIATGLIAAALLAGLAAAAHSPVQAAAGWTPCSKVQGDLAARSAGLSGALNRDRSLKGVFGHPKPGNVYKRPATSLCGDYDGDGHTDRALHYQCCTVSSPAPWVVLHRTGARWTIAYARLHDVTFTLRPQGTSLVTTEPRYAASDANCCPSRLRVGTLRWTGNAFRRTLRIVPAP